MVEKELSDLDKRAAREFQELANSSAFFPVTCRFRKVEKSEKSGVSHVFWPKGAAEFRTHFGNAANYFGGALEYIRLATGWNYPYQGLEVIVFPRRRRTSSGIAICNGSRAGEIYVFWGELEFTWTVLHELIHLFKKESEEGWVEKEAFRFMMELGTTETINMSTSG